jgi:CubicO group peptidase (beta-lactamase class C family)
VNWVSWERGPGDCAGAPRPREWPTVPPGEVRLDAAALESVAARIERRELENVHSLLVVREGRLAFERYFAGEDALWAETPKPVVFDAATLHDVRSISKSVVGALVGIAHGEGAIPDLDAPLAAFFPGQARGHEADLAGRTLRHALTMSAGLAWDELSHPYYDPRNDEHGLWLAADPLEYGLSRPPVAPPGAVFAYNGSLPVILAEVVEQATGLPFDRYAAEKLWCPLGVTRAEWVRHPSGVVVSASGLRLTPRDLARFGQMMLDGGRFAGQEIVPADYARASLEARVALRGGFGGATGYGYLWWIGRFPVASGNGGQRVVVDSETRTVIVMTAGLYDSPKQGDVPMQVLAGVLAAYR